jgi:hypothetical protein
VPVAFDGLKAPESFTLRGRKSGNECSPLTPIVNEMRCKPNREASSKADEKTCPEHNATPVRTARIQNNVDHGALRRRYYGTMRASRSCDFMLRGIEAGEIHRRLAHLLAPIDRHVTACQRQAHQRRSLSQGALFSQPPSSSLRRVFSQLDPVTGEAQPGLLVERAGRSLG